MVLGLRFFVLGLVLSLPTVFSPSCLHSLRRGVPVAFQHVATCSWCFRCPRGCLLFGVSVASVIMPSCPAVRIRPGVWVFFLDINSTHGKVSNGHVDVSRNRENPTSTRSRRPRACVTRVTQKASIKTCFSTKTTPRRLKHGG